MYAIRSYYGHTSRAFEAELQQLKDSILRMGGLVEEGFVVLPYTNDDPVVCP